MRKIIVSCVAVLISMPLVSMSALAEGAGIFSGKFELQLEGGRAFPQNTSSRSLIVENNLGGTAPYPISEIIGADFLNYGKMASYGADLSIGLRNGGSLFFAFDGTNGSGGRDLSGTVYANGAIPGTFDDGQRIENTWSPFAIVKTRTQAISAGYRHEFSNGFSMSAGLMYGKVKQDLQITFDDDPNYPGDSIVTGRSDNTMAGVMMGLGYQRALLDKWSLSLAGNIAVMANTYSYYYRSYNSEPLLVNPLTTIQSENVHSTAVRFDTSLQLGYQLTDHLMLSGKTGFTGYSGIGSGLENMLNENNTASVIHPSTATISLPYIRLGAILRF